MKKFIATSLLFFVTSIAYAGWSNEEKSAFFELLYNPDKVVDTDSKIKMINLIECVGTFYQTRYTFDQFKLFWYDSTGQNSGSLQEFNYVSQMCKQMIDSEKNTIWI